MKNTFKFLAIAFAAGALMLCACKKDKDSDPANKPLATVACVFGSEQLPVTFHEAYAINALSKAKTFDFALTAASSASIVGQHYEMKYPYSQVFFDNADREMTEVWKVNKKDDWGVDDMNLFKERGYVVDDYEYGDYTIAEDRDLVAFKVNEFDATSMDMSFSLTASMISVAEWVENEYDDEACAHTNMTVSASNLNFPLKSNAKAMHQGRKARR